MSDVTNTQQHTNKPTNTNGFTAVPRILKSVTPYRTRSIKIPVKTSKNQRIQTDNLTKEISVKPNTF